MFFLVYMRTYFQLLFLFSVQTTRRWEWFISLSFDWEFVSGKRNFKWPMVCNTVARKKRFLSLAAGILFRKPLFPTSCPSWNVSFFIAGVGEELTLPCVSAIALNIT